MVSPGMWAQTAAYEKRDTKCHFVSYTAYPQVIFVCAHRYYSMAFSKNQDERRKIRRNKSENARLADRRFYFNCARRLCLRPRPQFAHTYAYGGKIECGRSKLESPESAPAERKRAVACAKRGRGGVFFQNRGKIFAFAKRVSRIKNLLPRAKPRFCGAALNLYPKGIPCDTSHLVSLRTETVAGDGVRRCRYFIFSNGAR